MRSMITAIAMCVALGAAASPIVNNARPVDPDRATMVLSTGAVTTRIVTLTAYTGPAVAYPPPDSVALAQHQRLFGERRHSLAWPLDETWGLDGRSVVVRARVGGWWGQERPTGPALVYVCDDTRRKPRGRSLVAYGLPPRTPAPARPRIAWLIELPEWAQQPCRGGLWWGTGSAPGRPEAPTWAGGVAWEAVP